MSLLRPELVSSNKPATARGPTAYLVVHAAVEQSHGLIHGRLHDNGNSCAIGSYFRLHDDATLPTSIIDEIAAVNDAVPFYTKEKRRKFVLSWLKWKLTLAGMPGFRTKAEPKKVK